MKPIFKKYAACWAILLILFNILCFVTPGVSGQSKFDGAFWVGYVSITLAFVGQLACSCRTFRADTFQKLFYSLPLITVSYAGLILTIVFGGLCMIIPGLPSWVGIIICFVVLGFTAIAVVESSTATEIVSDVDKKVRTQTQFIRLETVHAQNIMNNAKDDAAREACKKVYEALQYSDPMSNAALAEDEAAIAAEMDALASAVACKKIEQINAISSDLIGQISKRNAKCRALK